MANSLGLSTQVPAKASYTTSGRSRVKRAAGRSLTLRHSGAPVLDTASASANAVAQAMANLGKDRIDTDAIQRFAALKDDRDMGVLLKARTLMQAEWGIRSSRLRRPAMDDFTRRPAEDLLFSLAALETKLNGVEQAEPALPA